MEDATGPTPAVEAALAGRGEFERDRDAGFGEQRHDRMAWIRRHAVAVSVPVTAVLTLVWTLAIVNRWVVPAGYPAQMAGYALARSTALALAASVGVSAVVVSSDLARRTARRPRAGSGAAVTATTLALALVTMLPVSQYPPSTRTPFPNGSRYGFIGADYLEPGASSALWLAAVLCLGAASAIAIGWLLTNGSAIWSAVPIVAVGTAWVVRGTGVNAPIRSGAREVLSPPAGTGNFTMFNQHDVSGWLFVGGAVILGLAAAAIVVYARSRRSAIAASIALLVLALGLTAFAADRASQSPVDAGPFWRE